MANDHTAEHKESSRTLVAYIAWIAGIGTAAVIYAGADPIITVVVAAVWVYLISRY